MPTHSSKPAVELLKLRFGKNKEGKWAIDGMSSIALTPRSADQERFFAIRDHILVAQPAFLGTIKFVLGQSIVPVVAHVVGEGVLRCLGTGFFISCSGLLVTAAHVITDPIERRYGGVTELDDLTLHARELQLGVMIPLNPLLQGAGYVYRPIEWASFLAQRADRPLPISGIDLKLTSDTAVCKVSPIGPDIPHQPLAIVQRGLVGTGMAVGKAATAVGYGAMQNVNLIQESNGTISGDFSFDLHASTGTIVEHFPDNLVQRQVPTPGACFSASLRLPGGMSGSPIFDTEGVYVHGVVSKGWINEQGIEDFGFGSMLAHPLHLPIRQLENKSLLELHGSDEHGFPKLSGPGM